jgi:hypothetical protein
MLGETKVSVAGEVSLFIHKKSREDRLFAAYSIESYSTSFDSWMF